jgi:hypothetical protein
MDSIDTGQGRVPASATAPRVPAGVRAGGQFRTAERGEASVELVGELPAAAAGVSESPRVLLELVPDSAAAMPRLDDGVVWDDQA